MSETQFYVSVAVAPTVTIIIVLIGVLLNNTNMNARFGDMNGRFDDLRSEIKAGLGALRSEMKASSDDLRSEMNARFEDIRETLRAGMAKNHSELLLKFAELDRRLSRLEVPATS